jgi:hypothetical protein
MTMVLVDPGSDPQKGTEYLDKQKNGEITVLCLKL